MANAWIIQPLPMAVTAPLGTDVGAPAYLANDYMGVVWGAAGSRQAASGGEYYHLLDIDLGTDRAVDAILGLGIAGIPLGSTFQIWANTDAQGPFGTPGFVSSRIARSAGTAELPGGLLTFQWSAPLNGTPPAAARYWRVLLFSPLRFDFRLSRILMGKRFVPGRNFSNGAAIGVREMGSLDFSRRGVLLRNRGRKLRTVGLTFSSIYREELEGIVLPMLEAIGNTDPVAVITNPDPNTQMSRRTYFGPLVGDLGAVQRRHDCYQLPINLVSLI